MTIQRYSYHAKPAISGPPLEKHWPDPEGEWVKWEDVERLIAENANMRGELIDRWRDHLRGGGVSVCDWSYPIRITERRLAAQLHKLGLVEKHPDREAYRFVQKGDE